MAYEFSQVTQGDNLHVLRLFVEDAWNIRNLVNKIHWFDDYEFTSPALHLKGAPLSGASLLLGPDADLSLILAAPRPTGDEHYLVMEGMEVYLTSGWLVDSRGVYYRYSANPKTREQFVWRSSHHQLRTAVRAVRTPHDLTPVTLSQVPRDVRFDYMQYLAGDTWGHHSRTIQSLRGTPGAIRLGGRWSNFDGTGRTFPRLRQALKAYGAIVANADERDVGDAIEALDNIQVHCRCVFDEVMESLVDHWNERSCDTIYYASGCRDFHTEEPTTVRGGHMVCQDCLEERYVWACDIEEYIDHSDAYSDGIDYYYNDPDPDDDYDDDDDHPVGVRSYGANVLDYCSPDNKITPSIYGEFLLGVELEVESRLSEVSEATGDTADFFDGYAILKHDGSLGRGGFEIVTAPRGLPEHIEVFKEWEPHSSLRAWDTGRCGLHVHISSQAFTQATLGKFIEFINSPANDQFIEAIAGRHPETNYGASTYCQREGALYTGNPKKTVEGKSIERYRMVNTQNLSYRECRRLGLHEDHARGKSINTIELRIFRATLKKERLLAQIEFAHAAVMFCRWASFRALTGREFLTWLQDMAGQYPHLARWFGVRANTKVVDPQPKARETADV